jgi:hypothetical protein
MPIQQNPDYHRDYMRPIARKVCKPGLVKFFAKGKREAETKFARLAAFPNAKSSRPVTAFPSILRLSSRFFFYARVFDGSFPGIFQLADCILNLALHLFGGAVHLHFFIVGPFASLTLYASGDVFHFPFHAILIHSGILPCVF